MRLLFFNPENDLALAAYSPHYTPPASALQMAADLELLPLRWARAGDAILLRDGSLRACFEAPEADTSVPTTHSPLVTRHPTSNILDVSSATAGQARRSSLTSLLPWGWSPLLVRQLRDRGIPQELLPTDEEMRSYRDYSSRATAVRLLSRLRAEWPDAFTDGRLVGESTWCTTEDEVAQAIERYGGKAMLKAPWSGSGRGVHPVLLNPVSPKTQAWIRRTLKYQDGVEVEPYYEKVQDLAFEFWALGGAVSYEGLSVFETTAGGVYAGNLVASERAKERQLECYVSPSLLHDVREHLTELLSASGLPRWYDGPVGVDLMIVASGTSYSLHPLVEINLRMTMGWVALQLTNELPPDGMGVFCIRQRSGRYQVAFN